MVVFLSPSHNPYFNIACEEFFIKSVKEEVIFLYRNAPSVILGKHQNAFSEVNLKLAQQNNVAFVRRLSGGACVFHDLGNLNYSHLEYVETDNKVDFHLFLEPLVTALNILGASAVIGPRNNVLVAEKKITGTACHTIKNRVMHHGTLLYNADLELLDAILTPVNKKFESKAVKSISSSVTNLVNHLDDKMSVEQFEQFLYRYFLNTADAEWRMSEDQLKEINLQVIEKYNTWEWNFGYSPKFKFIWKDKWVFFIEKGIIQSIAAVNPNEETGHELLPNVGMVFNPLDFE